MKTSPPLILASSSPRRKQLLEQVKLSFTVIPAQGVEEKHSGAPVRELVRENALLKAQAVAKDLSCGVVLGADTVLEFQGRLLGKALNKREAFSFLSDLSGATHQVHTGLALIKLPEGDSVTALGTTEVTFKTLNEAIIKAYLNSGEYKDKAGAYGIQGLGAILVKEIKGDYSNVVGLPLGLLADLLPDFGILLPWF